MSSNPCSRFPIWRRRPLLLSLLLASLGLLILVACQGVPMPVEVTRVVMVTPTLPPTPEPVGSEVDRVGFPTGYTETFQIYYEFDRPDNRSARVIYANDLAASVTRAQLERRSVEPGEPYPYGSVLVMEVYRTQRAADGQVLLDADGRYLRDALAGIFVMRKELGFGAKYGTQRNGEWEYVAYRPDGSILTPPERSGACAACHVEASAGRDWVFGAGRHFAALEGAMALEVAENEILLADYLFSSDTLTVTVGTEVTWTNKDVVFHTVTAGDWSFGSGMLRPNAAYRYKFEQPGSYGYICSVHPSMKGTVLVTE